jgi:hypothetical protein
MGACPEKSGALPAPPEGLRKIPENPGGVLNFFLGEMKWPLFRISVSGFWKLLPVWVFFSFLH